MKTKKLSLLLVTTLLLVLFLQSCGNTAPPDTVQVDLFYGYSSSTSTRISTKTVHNSHAIQQLYQTITNLPPTGNGIMHCPMDRGYDYRLLFLQAGTTEHTIIADPDGCQMVKIDDNTGDMRVATHAFWLQLAQTLGVSTDSLLHLPPVSSGFQTRLTLE